MSNNFAGQATMKAILGYKDGYVLVRQEGDDKWILPGGRLDFGETPDECLIREVKEEIGVDCEIEKIISVDAYQGKVGKVAKLFVFYLAKVQENQEVQVDNEIAEYIVVSRKEESDKYKMHDNQRIVLEKFLVSES